MCYVYYVTCVMFYTIVGRKAKYYGPEGNLIRAGRRYIYYGPEGDYITGRKAMLCGPKGPGRKAYVGKSYTGELTKHLCLLVVFMFFRY